MAPSLDAAARARRPPASSPGPARARSGSSSRASPTGNPHSDLDFFTRGGEHLPVGRNAGRRAPTAAARPSSSSPTATRSTRASSPRRRPRPASPTRRPPSASSTTSRPRPRARPLLNTFNPYAVAQDTQVIIDATDANGRCHDQSFGGDGAQSASSGQAGRPGDHRRHLPANPVEIGLTSHVGESHTVNVDPKRPHIAYSVTSDSASRRRRGQAGQRGQSGSDARRLRDGRPSSCMYFPAGTTTDQKRAACRPQVFRYR